MTPRLNHFQLLGTLALCAALFGCIRQEGLYPTTVMLPPISPDYTQTVSAVPPPEPQQEPPADHGQTMPSPALQETPPQTSSSTPIQEPPAPPAPLAPKPATTRFFVHSLFINREVASDNIKMFPRWMDMLARYNGESHNLDTICGADQYNPCKLKGWKEFLETLRGEPLPKQLDAVNRFLNSYPYIDDIVNWGFDNYWETPYEFQRKSGNCKDYAIAKFMSLRALGVPNDKMRVEVVRDLNLGGIIHAVLVVFIDEKAYMLDNQIKQVMPTDKIYHYEPIYSINEQHWWQHFMLD